MYRRTVVISFAVGVALTALIILPHRPSAQETAYPAAVWQHVADAARAGWSTAGLKARRPARGSHVPGTFWYYNNWDFNVLGTVFERLTKTNLFVEFKNRIADPIGMEDYRIEDGTYVTGPDSVYPAYPFRMTARDMARFGLLFLHNGSWRGRQVVPADWVKESTTSYSDTGQAGGYGYLWWVAV